MVKSTPEETFHQQTQRILETFHITEQELGIIEHHSTFVSMNMCLDAWREQILRYARVICTEEEEPIIHPW